MVVRFQENPRVRPGGRNVNFEMSIPDHQLDPPGDPWCGLCGLCHEPGDREYRCYTEEERIEAAEAVGKER